MHSLAYTGHARMTMTVLDVLHLAEHYGELAAKEMNLSRYWDGGELAVLYAKHAWHHAFTFCTLDDSFTKEWKD